MLYPGNPFRNPLILLAAGVLLGLVPAFGQAGRGGGGGPTTVLGTPGLAAPARELYSLAGGRRPALSDLELTAVTRLEEQVEKQVAAVAAAKTALLAAVFAPARNEAAIKQRNDALAEAELALALARAEAFAKFQASMRLSPAKLAYVVQQFATGNVTPASVIFGETVGAPRGGN
jgi:hypothetical protein